MTAPAFKMFTGALKAYTDPTTGRKRLSCTASSTIEDLHGDEIDAACVASMSEQAIAKSMTIFLNHEYKVPEDVFGKTIASSYQKRGADKTGKDIWDLDLGIDLNEANPRAVETYKAIDEQGVTLGVSIGAIIRDWEFRDEKKFWEGGMRIKSVELLEASIVGIPANPRSWVKTATRAIKRAHSTEAALLSVNGSATAEAVDEASEDEEELVTMVSAATTPVETVEKEAAPEVEGVEDDVEEAAAPEEEAAADDEEATDEAAVEETTSSVDLTAAKSIAGSLLVSEEQSPLLELVLSALETAAAEIVSLRQSNGELKTKAESVDAANQERDEAKAELAEAVEVLKLMASVPLVRKTSMRRVVQESSLAKRLGGTYDKQYLDLIESDENDER